MNYDYWSGAIDKGKQNHPFIFQAEEDFGGKGLLPVGNGFL